MSRFKTPKTIKELAEIASSVRCIGIERVQGEIDCATHARYASTLTLSSTYGEMTTDFSHATEPPKFFGLVALWKLSITMYRSCNVSLDYMNVDRFSPLFGYPMDVQTMLDILGYIGATRGTEL